MKISIITVTYNSAKTIADCIASVNSQSYPFVEHIIVDGASTDNTIEIIKTLPNRISKIISEPDKGIYDAMNKGISFATGDVVGILNSDDKFFSPQSIEKIVRCFENEKVDAVYGNLIFTDETNKIIRTWNSNPFESGLFAKSWCPAHPTFYCKRVLYEKLGMYKTDYQIAADVELMIRFLEINKINSCFINEVLVNMRVGGVSNQGIKSIITITREMKRAFNENGLPFNLSKYLFHKGLKIRELL
jgi:glycosyltransferase involved in cell wall biosynthesis